MTRNLSFTNPQFRWKDFKEILVSLPLPFWCSLTLAIQRREKIIIWYWTLKFQALITIYAFSDWLKYYFLKNNHSQVLWKKNDLGINVNIENHNLIWNNLVTVPEQINYSTITRIQSRTPQTNYPVKLLKTSRIKCCTYTGLVYIIRTPKSFS